MELGPAGVFVVAAPALLIGGGGVGYLISIYNTLVQLAQNIEKPWSNIDVLLQQRHDELLNLVETCKGYMKFRSLQGYAVALLNRFHVRWCPAGAARLDNCSAGFGRRDSRC